MKTRLIESIKETTTLVTIYESPETRRFKIELGENQFGHYAVIKEFDKEIYRTFGKKLVVLAETEARQFIDLHLACEEIIERWKDEPTN